MTQSLYVHVPFCRKRCIYCDFYSCIYDDSLALSYIDTISREIGHLEDKFRTIYIGGGTPSALDRSHLEKLLKSVRACYGKPCEVTVEANPESLSEDKIRLLLDNGVNRISIGLQSLDDMKLERLGRIHDSEAGISAVRKASKMGFSDISVDLIYGVWGEGLEEWQEELDKALELPVTHISCYALTYEKGTPLFNAIRDGGIFPLDDDAVAAMYDHAIERLSVRGFEQYEVSNFAKEGHACKHNLNYWNNEPYIGVGASAVSYLEGVRQENVPDVKAYMGFMASGKSVVGSSEKLSAPARAKETAAVKIRTREGIDFRWFKEVTGYDFLSLEKRAMEEMLEDGLIKYIKSGEAISGVRLNRKGFMFADTVSSAFL